MVAVVWINEVTWEACVDYAREFIPGYAEVRLVHISPGDVEDLVQEGAGGMLGRRPTPPPGREVHSVAAQEAGALLAAACSRLRRPAELVALSGHPERELLRACGDADLLVLGRDREPQLGPKSLSHETRFVVDHVGCAVLLVWTQEPPGPETVKPPPHLREGRRRLTPHLRGEQP
jgi:nucleotide-binding universal stress UspA family protein